MHEDEFREYQRDSEIDGSDDSNTLYIGILLFVIVLGALGLLWLTTRNN